MLGIALLGTVAAISVAFFATKVGAGVARALRKDVFEKVESFSNEEFNHFSTASLITRTTNDITHGDNDAFTYCMFCTNYWYWGFN